ncbi:MAG TPA: hypothetical protein VIX19_17200 [Terriglobales bacterium]
MRASPTNHIFRLLLLIFSLMLVLTLTASAQDASSQIKAEMERVQESLKDKPIANPDLAEIGNMISATLSDGGNALAAGRVYLSLEKLAQATDLLEGARTAVDKAEALKAGMPAFEQEWNKASLELSALDKQSRQRDWSHKQAGIRALSETAQGKAIPLLEGSQGFATANGPQAGLFYMGQAQGEAAFAAFAFSLNLPRDQQPISLRSLLPELERLQAKTNAAFQPPRSIELHPRFIALNSTLKLAGELDAAQAYAGTLYEYLEATRHYGMLDAVAPDTAKQARLKEAIAAAQKQIATSKRDDSIARVFLERAESQSTPHADGSPPLADEWRSAQVIVEQVLPAYYAALKPAAPVQRAKGITTTVTLVRWPYT